MRPEQQKKKVWSPPIASRLGSFVEVTKFTKTIGSGDAFSPLLASV